MILKDCASWNIDDNIVSSLMKVRATIKVVHRLTTYVKDKRYALNIFVYNHKNNRAVIEQSITQNIQLIAGKP